MKRALFFILFFALSLASFDFTTQADFNVNDGEKDERLKEMYRNYIIGNIEADAEIKIPKYVEFKYIEYMYNLAAELQLPRRLVFRLVYRESTFRDTVMSPEGAYGFMQIMPKTERLYEKKLNTDSLGLTGNYKNIYIGMHLLKDLYVYWYDKGVNDFASQKLMLACYNAGIVAVIEYKGVPPFEETLNYIDFILREHSDPEYDTNKNSYANTVKIST